MENTYKYLFPFEKIPQGTNILIYGAGILGQDYLKQIKITNYCKIRGVVDKNFAEYKNSDVPVYGPEKIRELNFDFVVIALRSAIGVPRVKRILEEQGVAEDKMICVLERTLPQDNLIFQMNRQDAEVLHLSIYSSKPSFALFMAGGIGDMVTYKRLVEELHRLVPDAMMDIFSVNGLEFLKWLYCEEDYVGCIMLDLGKRYNQYKERYSFSLSFMGAGFLNVDFISENDFLGYEDVLFQMEKLKEKCRFENFNFSTPVAVMFYRRIFNKVNCYTGFNYGDVFSIENKRIKIPFPEEYVKEFAELGLANYITINTGNGLGDNNATVAKSWPIDRFQKTVEIFRYQYPNIQIVQIGIEGEPLIVGADRYFMGESFGLVAEILKHALFHLDIEGGLVHLASQIGTKCVVLFGPTLTEYNAYDNNINIKVGSCHGCYGLYLDTNHCARHMKEPECMYSITPEIVMSHINEYMKEWEKKCPSEK